MFFQPYDLLKAIHRRTGGREYFLLKQALDRLVKTVVQTTIRRPDGKRSAAFHWLERVEEQVDEKGNSKGIVIELPRWLYEGITRDLVLAIPPEYFDLTGGLERWLYRVVRKHAGNQSAGWSCTFATLHAKSGSSQRPSDFARDLRRIITADKLPEYHLSAYVGTRGDDCLHAVRRSLLARDHPAHQHALLSGVGKRRTRPKALG